MPGIDNYCSSSPWLLAARHAFHDENDLYIYGADYGYAAFLLMKLEPWGRVLMPLDASWLFPTPFVGDLSLVIPEFLEHLKTCEDEWDCLLVSGFTTDGYLIKYLLRYLYEAFDLFQGPEITRCRASLGDGVDAFLKRRGTRFAKNQRRIERRIREMGYTFEYFDGDLDEMKALELYERAIKIEARSWKGLDKVGITEGGMYAFYRNLVAIQAPRGHMRMGIAQVHGKDAGYILGGVRNGLYRGYQFSYAQEYKGLSLGNVMQMDVVRRCCEEGLHTYDLGADMEYKYRWAEQQFTTSSVLARRRSSEVSDLQDLI